MPTQSALPYLAYLDERRVDEVWALVKRTGVPAEETSKITNKVASKFTFKLGALLSSVLSGGIETTGELGGGRETTSKLLASLRYLLLPELITTDPIDSANIHQVQTFVGGMVKVDLADSEFFPIPCTADLIVAEALFYQYGEDDDGEDDDEGREKHQRRVPDLLPHYATLKDAERSLPFISSLWNLSVGLSSHSNTLNTLESVLAPDLRSAFALNRDDLVMMTARIARLDDENTYVAMMCDEANMRRKTICYCGSQHAVVFGRLMAVREAGDIRLLVIDPIGIETTNGAEQ